MVRHSNGEYERDFSDWHQVPPEPIGWWELDPRWRPWARDEDHWGPGSRGRPDRPREEWPVNRRAPEDYWSGHEDYWRGHGGYWRRREGSWRGGEPDRRRWSDEWLETGDQPADLDHGTGAWGPGQAEPGLWRREPTRRRSRRQWYDRDLAAPGLDDRRRGIEWDGWGYQVSRGRRPAERGRPRRTSSDEWGRYSSGGAGDRAWGAWDYGRHREHMLEATGEAARRWQRSRSRRPDLREGEAWNEIGPGRAGERRPREGGYRW